MRLLVILIAWLIAGVLHGQNPLLPPYEAGATESFTWTGTDVDLNKNPFTTAGTPSPTRLNIDYRGKTPIVYTLRILGPAIVSRLTSKHYAIYGHVSYQNLAPGSFLELERWFAPDQPGGKEKFYYSRTLADAGPLARMVGTDDGRDFSAPFDATGATTSLVRLVLKLHLGGPGAIQFNGVRLAQYPDNPLAEGHDTIGVTMLNNKVNYTLAGMENVPLNFIRVMLKDPAVADSSRLYSVVAAKNVPYEAIKDLLKAFQEAGISNVKINVGVPLAPPLRAVSQPIHGVPSEPNRRLFSLGFLASAGMLILAVVTFVLAWRWRRYRHERGLRRIASLDT
jgi:hypothetical protein